jgi:hypothetical protein
MITKTLSYRATDGQATSTRNACCSGAAVRTRSVG